MYYLIHQAQVKDLIVKKASRWDEIRETQCSVARASTVLGDRWTLLILSDIFLGARRFEDFQSRLQLSRTTLTSRLKLLETHEVLRRDRYQDNPPRYEYRLTQKGRDLYPVITTILNWGDTYYSDEAGPPVLRAHLDCGHDIQPVLSCPDCQGAVTTQNIRARKRDSVPGLPDVERGPVLRKEKAASG